MGRQPCLEPIENSLVYTHFPGNLQVDLINLININQLFSSEGVILNFRLEGL